MKILYTATVLSHICQFHLPYLKELQDRGNAVHVAARNNLAEKNGLALKYADKFTEIPFQRSPFDRHNIGAYKQLKQLIDRENYDLILCNTPVGGILTRLAARKARKRGCRVIYMAHGFHFYQGAPKKNWLLYYPIEKAMAKLCDMLITITEEDYLLAKKKFHTKVAHIHGVGVSTERYHPTDEAACREMRQAEGLSDTDFVILCTGELNQNKDQATLIRAAAKVKEKIPNLKVLLAGNGPLEQELKTLVSSLGAEKYIHFLGYRTDLEKVVPAVDVVVSCSHREGMPLNIIEAMLCGKPVVAAANRGSRELIHYGQNGYLFTAGDTPALGRYILEFCHKPELCQTMGQDGMEKAKNYTVKSVKKTLLPLLLENMTEG
ncbi:MAG: glycosyltransferase family 4 protein [Faecousia sp.]